MANKLKEMRYKRMLTISELARRSGLTRPVIWRIETDPKYNPRYSTMSALAKALEMPVIDIFFTDNG